jgi:hypothetical protein
MTLRYRQIIGNTGKILLRTAGQKAVLPQYIITVSAVYDSEYFIPNGTYYLTNLNYDSTIGLGSMAFDGYAYTMYWAGTGIINNFGINGVGPAYCATSALTYNHGVMTGTAVYTIGVDGVGTINVSY